jgi:hypothetical protein
MICHRCEDTGWVCEEHPERPWEGPHACPCGAAGMPYPDCIPSDGLTPRQLPAGFIDNERMRRRKMVQRVTERIPHCTTQTLAVPLGCRSIFPSRGMMC